MSGWGRWRGIQATDASVPLVRVITVPSGPLHCFLPSSGRLDRPAPDTGLPAAIPAVTIRRLPAARFRRGGAHSPYRPQAPSLLRDGPTAGVGLVPPIVRTVGDDRGLATGRPFRAGPPCVAGRELRAADSRPYRPHRGFQVVPGTGSYRSQAGADLRHLGGSGGRGTTRQCSRRSAHRPVEMIPSAGEVRRPLLIAGVVHADRGSP